MSAMRFPPWLKHLEGLTLDEARARTADGRLTSFEYRLYMIAWRNSAWRLSTIAAAWESPTLQELAKADEWEEFWALAAGMARTAE